MSNTDTAKTPVAIVTGEPASEAETAQSTAAAAQNATGTTTNSEGCTTTTPDNNVEKNAFLGYTDDGRKQFVWKSVYPKKAFRAMRSEAIYIGVFFFIACIILILNYFRTFNSIFGIGPERVSFPYFIYLIGSGLLGGIVFEMKVLCTVVAKGFWHKDRTFWRFMSPLVSMGTAYIIGAMVGAGLLTGENSASNAWAIAIGFFAGYFADEAAGKMKEVALVFFGKTKAGEQTANVDQVEDQITAAEKANEDEENKPKNGNTQK